ncbi:MAG: ATP-grasp domain-containing protein [Candidatus Gastranaerophilales bacterium]|nr:ATP-grasp domain-containing protein [Candidatus Gastranaerophilales bacterium]
MILIISDEKNEDMSYALYENLKGKSADVRLISQDSLPIENNITLFIKNKKLAGEILFNDEIIKISDINAIYTRFGVNISDKKLSQKVKKEIELERQIYMNMFFEHIDAMVINRTKSQFFNSSKLFQSWIIKQYGFKIPDSIISNTPSKIKEFVEQKKQVIYKSASAERSKVQKLKKDDMKKLDLLRYCPHLFQECIEGIDIRVHTLASGETFACEIQSQTSDYRYDKERNIKIIDIPDDIKKSCVQMTLDMGLYLSGIDLRRTKNNDYYCFEVNPSPAFTWYEIQTGLPITNAAADMMINSDRYKNKAIRKY